MRAMGDKVTARQTMQKAGVPIVPGHHRAAHRRGGRALGREDRPAGDDQGRAPAAAARACGWCARRARSRRRVARARGEARASFGDDGLYVEKFVEQPRHIEIQILADAHGNCVHLFERECSIQRRHQKVIEEAPGNGISPELREQMGAAAVAAARAVELRRRRHLRVPGRHARRLLLPRDEHARAGRARDHRGDHRRRHREGDDPRRPRASRSAFAQEDLRISGHAIEARIYAEDPDNNFAPSPGEIVGLPARRRASACASTAASTRARRVTVYYDPMVAKLVVWGARPRRGDRPPAPRALGVRGEGHQDLDPVPPEGACAIRSSSRAATTPASSSSTWPAARARPEDGRRGARRRAASRFMLAAIAAYRRDKERAARGAAAGGPERRDPWKEFGRRAQMRGGLR